MKRREFMIGAAAATGALLMNDAVFAQSGEKLFPGHPPVGIPKGINPGRVSWIHAPGLVRWNGVDYWWKNENFNEINLAKMISMGIMQLTGASSAKSAWQALFEWRNNENKKSGGYSPGQKIAIKTNMNGAGEYSDDPHGQHAHPYGTPLVLQKLLQSLVNDGGVRPQDITVYDVCRIFPDYMQAMCTSGELKGVQFRHRNPGGSDDSRADRNAPIEWSGPVDGLPTYFPTLLTEATYLINLANLKGHSWGMTLGFKNHFGSFVNAERRLTPQAAGLHPNIIHGKMGEYSTLADLNSREEIASKTVLTILDALITAPSETGNIHPASAKWQMEPFNGDYACSLFFSQDPVAIDSVGADFLTNEPVMLEHNSVLAHKASMENYLHEASQLNKPPSSVKYKAAERVESLGVHEHWNNAQEKKYSGKAGSGIELVYQKLQ